MTDEEITAHSKMPDMTRESIAAANTQVQFGPAKRSGGGWKMTMTLPDGVMGVYTWKGQVARYWSTSKRTKT